MEVKALRTRPTLNPEFLWLRDAYMHLSRSRQLGSMGEFYIPMTEYVAYAEYYQINDVEQRLFLHDVVSQVDAILLHERYDELKKNRKD